MALVGYEWLIVLGIIVVFFVLGPIIVVFFVLGPKTFPKLARDWAQAFRDTRKIVNDVRDGPKES